MRWFEIIGESSSSGGTGSGSIATIAGSGKSIKSGTIGAGFDPDGDWGVYQKAKTNKKSKKPSVITR